MNIEEARLYLEHTSKEDFNLEEHQKENRYQAIQVVLKEIERLNNIINELKWKPIEEYDKGNYDWVLVKYFDGGYECVPCVAEKRFDKWYNRNDEVIESDVKYFIDMQQIDKLQELKGDGSNE